MAFDVWKGWLYVLAGRKIMACVGLAVGAE